MAAILEGVFSFIFLEFLENLAGFLSVELFSYSHRSPSALMQAALNASKVTQNPRRSLKNSEILFYLTIYVTVCEICQRVIRAPLSPNQWSGFLSRSGNIFCLQKTAFVVSCSKSAGDICTTVTGYKHIY